MRRFLILLVVTSSTLLICIEKINGYKDFKFGMTLSEADSLYTNDRIEPSQYEGFDNDLIADIQVYGEDGQITVRFKKNILHSIVLSFDRFESGFESTSKILAELIHNKYGEPAIIKPGNAKWFFPDGGMITLVIFGVEDKGLVNIIYAPSDTL